MIWHNKRMGKIESSRFIIVNRNFPVNNKAITEIISSITKIRPKISGRIWSSGKSAVFRYRDTTIDS